MGKDGRAEGNVVLALVQVEQRRQTLLEDVASEPVYNVGGATGQPSSLRP